MNNSYTYLLNAFKEFDMDTLEYQKLALQLSEKLDHQEMVSLLSLFVRLKIREETARKLPEVKQTRTKRKVSTVQSAESKDPPVKRRRGRPRKNDAGN